MAKIFQMSELMERRRQARCLTDLCKEALSKVDRAPLLEKEPVVNKSKFKRLMEARIMRGIVQKKEISTAAFLCGLYSAEILTKFLRATEGDVGSISYLKKFGETGNPYFYQTAGDHLFYICAAFPGYADRLRRQLTLQDYRDIGARCYYTFYDKTGVEIGYHMSQMFTPMANIVHQYVLNPKE